MAMEASEIARLIKESLPDAEVKIEDLRGDGDHYAAQVVSAAFAGKSRVQQHQMVYEALRGRMGDQLHALALQASARKAGEPQRRWGLGVDPKDRATRGAIDRRAICPHIRVKEFGEASPRETRKMSDNPVFDRIRDDVTS